MRLRISKVTVRSGQAWLSFRSEAHGYVGMMHVQNPELVADIMLSDYEGIEFIMKKILPDTRQEDTEGL